MRKIIIFLIAVLGFMPLYANGNATNALKFNLIINKAINGKWQQMPINEIIIKVGFEFLGTPYLGGTLEGDTEMCRYNLSGLDCVTFYENSLAIARMIKKGGSTLEDFESELTYLRYRDGILTDYSSRLHYSADYFYNNAQKDVWTDITREIGGIKFEKYINFMSTHPQYYDALKSDNAMINKIVEIENIINKNEIYYIPKDKVAEAEKYINSGDIIGITSSVEGLDYNHTGLAYRDESGILCFFHASSDKKKVILDQRLSDYLNTVRKHTGISVMRAK